MDSATQTKPTERVDEAEPTEQRTSAGLPAAPTPSDTTPEEFYAEVTKRPDIRAILEELAKR